MRTSTGSGALSAGRRSVPRPKQQAGRERHDACYVFRASVVISPAVATALERYACALRAPFGERVAEVTLFGSHARGAAHEDSDVDVLVAMADLTDAERVEAIDLAYFADQAADDWVGLSPLVYSTAEVGRMRSGGRRLPRDIDREGVRL